jgi:hypothetical protein
MRILVGRIMDWSNDRETLALEIPGIGIVRAYAGDRDEAFDHIDLTGKQMLVLRDQIDRELIDAKGNMERHTCCNTV